MSVSKQRLQDRLTAIKSAEPIDINDIGVSRHADRESERHSAYKFGTLRLDTGEEIQCIVQDMSGNGVKVRLPNYQALTPSMTLAVRGAGIERRVQLRWQEDDEAGLSF
ncbi:MAG: PilZ domain-containing protein [Pseudomonadota bacterium]